MTAMRTPTLMSKRPLIQHPKAASGQAPRTAGIKESPSEPIPVEWATAQARRAPSTGLTTQMPILAIGIRWRGYRVRLTSWLATRIETATINPQYGRPLCAKASRPATIAGANPSAIRSSRRRALSAPRFRERGWSAANCKREFHEP